MMRRLRDGWWNLRTVRMAGQPVGLRHCVRWMSHSGLGHVLGRLRSAARDAYFARNGWRNYCVPGDTEILELCPACAVRALRRGETRGLADTWLHPTHAFREVDAQLSARERVVANLLLTEGRTA